LHQVGTSSLLINFCLKEGNVHAHFFKNGIFDIDSLPWKQTQKT